MIRTWKVLEFENPWKGLARSLNVEISYFGVAVYFSDMECLSAIPKPWPCRESGRRKLMWKYSRPAVWRKHACSRALHAPLLNAVVFYLFPATSFRLSWNITASHFSSATSLSISPCQDCWRSGWILELKFRTPVCCSLLVCLFVCLFVCLSLLPIVASTTFRTPIKEARTHILKMY